MQTESGLQRWLKAPFLYNLFQNSIGANAVRRRFIHNNVRARTGDRVIDIGCGPAQILPWLPVVEYLGFDVSQAYIASAKRKYAGKGTFVVGDTKTIYRQLAERVFQNVTAQVDTRPMRIPYATIVLEMPKTIRGFRLSVFSYWQFVATSPRSKRFQRANNFRMPNDNRSRKVIRCYDE